MSGCDLVLKNGTLGIPYPAAVRADAAVKAGRVAWDINSLDGEQILDAV